MFVSRVSKSKIVCAAESPSRSSGSLQSKSDVANFRISFKGFTESIEDSGKYIASFRRQHFETVGSSYIGVRVTGPYDKQKSSIESPIYFVGQKMRDRIFNIITTQKLPVSLRIPTGAHFTIVRNNSDWIRKMIFECGGANA